MAVIIILLLLIVSPVHADTYWVSPTGAAASWVACKSETPLSGTAACSRARANSSASAGDVVYFRDGNYTLADFGTGIAPSHNGTSENPITFAAYTGETPIITGTTKAYGIYLDGDSYIKIDGITFQNIGFWAYIVGSSHHNEIARCTFTSTAGNEAGGGINLDGTICATHNCWNTHNWFHHNTFSNLWSSLPCIEGGDLVRIGEAYHVDESPYAVMDNYNTFEDNVFYHSGHTVIDNYGQYNVFVRNVTHNEPWHSGCTEWKDNFWTSASSVESGTGSKSLTTDTGLTITKDNTIGIVASSDYSVAMSGLITTYNSETGALVFNATKSTGSGTYDSWIVSRGPVPVYTNSAFDGLYGHRNWQISDDFGRDGLYNLYEDNRFGYAGINPKNDGAENFTIAAPRNIVRYNTLYGSMASGMYFKYAKADPSPLGNGISHSWGGAWNAVYNNTIYKSGYGYDYVYAMSNESWSKRGIAQYNSTESGTTGNEIRNNLIFGGEYGDICRIGTSMPCSTQDWDYVSNNYSSTDADPLFIDTSMTDVTSLTLPDLRLQASSPAINGGTYLTLANGAGDNNATLHVDNALFFQAGTWGSSLATISADWIAIGIVSNVVQISSIDYATNTITLASVMTWADDAPIWLYKKSDGTRVLYGSSPDYGAYEYPTSEGTVIQSTGSFSGSLH